MSHSNKRIILSGGGTGGAVFPLLAVVDELRKIDPHVEFLFVGTSKGPERKMVEDAGIKFQGIPAAKFRRYFSFANFTDLFVFLYSLFAARKIIKQYKPRLVFSAGGFVAVPVSWMANWQKIPVAIHQQDAGIGLANRLIAPFASLITAAFEATAKEFSSGSGFSKKQLKPAAVWVGNPYRKVFLGPASPNSKQKFGLNDSLPILLIVGGSTGSTQINEVCIAAMPELVKAHQVIHITGPGKNIYSFKHPNYHPFEFLSKDMPDAMKIADIVISRAGLSNISELSVLGKIAIIVPMPGTHQEENADLLKKKPAAVVLDSLEFNPQDLPRIVVSVKFNVGRQKLLVENIKKIMPHDAAERIAKLIHHYVK
jgi:UDP-N-acetylglucosamine--N-acetylmuramyl-(pentapeptide) pyrophosphoryl-undecaprenol N-acetylglucosamine transferase